MARGEARGTEQEGSGGEGRRAASRTGGRLGDERPGRSLRQPDDRGRAVRRSGEGQAAGLTAAFYWTTPVERTPAAVALSAFRNYDGAGTRFLDWSVPTAAAAPTSLFASRNAAGDELVAIVLNLDPKVEARGIVDISGCAGARVRRALRYVDGLTAFKALERGAVSEDGQRLTVSLPPYSITVLELDRPKP